MPRSSCAPHPVRRGVAVALTLVVLVGSGLAVASPVASARALHGATPIVADGPDTRSVERLYAAYFQRDPDVGGVAHWRAQHAAGTGLAAISEEFARSAEFTARYGALDDREFVDLVYRNVLGRSADVGGAVHWVGQLAAGRSRGEVMLGFSDSAEFKARTGLVGEPLRRPEPAQSEAAAAPTAAAIAAARPGEHFAYMATQPGSGEPVRWDPCTPVGVRVDLAGAPAGASAAVPTALARLNEATGMEWSLTTAPSALVEISWPEPWPHDGRYIGMGGFRARGRSAAPIGSSRARSR